MLTGSMTKRRSNATNAYDLMSDIIEYIKEEPKRVWMPDWIITGKENIRSYFGKAGPICNTVGCIAGNTLALKGFGLESGSISQEAQQILGGNDRSLKDSLENLFLNTEVDAWYGTKKYANIVAKRIRDFQTDHEEALRKITVDSGRK